MPPVSSKKRSRTRQSWVGMTPSVGPAHRQVVDDHRRRVVADPRRLGDQPAGPVRVAGAQVLVDRVPQRRHLR